MKVAKLIIAITATLLGIAALVAPQVIEAKRTRNNKPVWVQRSGQDQQSEVTVGASVHNDTSEELRKMKQLPLTGKREHEANENPKIPHKHKDSSDPVVQRFASLNTLAPTPSMPGAQQN